MGSEENDVCEEYASSLEDLTFNSKPLINVLTMLAEENSQFASKIVGLIERRILEVQQSLKLPSLYLLDSIIKNVGGDYLHLVSQILERVFLCAFVGGNEKIRKDMYKLRNTWSQYFSTKVLHDLDVMVNRVDPGWPISPAPPPSPSIHVNPKFLKKVDDPPVLPASSVDQGLAVPEKVLAESNQKLLELQRLQEEQLKLTEQEIQEHQLKRDLLLKKQQSERQLLLQQQQQQLVTLRLQVQDKGDEPMELIDSKPKSSLKPVATQAETTPSGPETSASRDPRLRHGDHRPSKPLEDERVVVLVDRENKGKSNGLEQPSERPSAADKHKHLAGAGDGRQRGRSPQLEKAPAFAKKQGPREEKNSGKGPVYEEPRRPRRGGREFRGAHRGGGPESDKWQRETGREERKFRKPPENDKPGQREESRKRNFRGRLRNRGAGRRRGRDYDRYDGEGGRPEKPRFGDKEARERRGGFKARFAGGPPAREDRPPPQGEFHPRHLSDEPMQKKPKPLMPEHELINLRTRPSRSPPRGRASHLVEFPHPPSQCEPFDFDDFDPHAPGPRPPFHPERFHQPPGAMGGPPPHQRFPDEHGDFPPLPLRDEGDPSFEIPKELLLDQQGEIMRQAEKRLMSGDMTMEQHHELMERLQQLYELQRQKERLKQLQQNEDMPPHEELHQTPLSHPEHPAFQEGPREPFISDGPPSNVAPRGPWLDEPGRGPRMGPPGHPNMGPDRHEFGRGRPPMGAPIEDFHGARMEQDHGPMDHARPLMDSERPFDGGPKLGMGPEGPPLKVPFECGPLPEGPQGPPMVTGLVGPLESSALHGTPMSSGLAPQPASMMEKKNVDDLFRRLVQVGVIKVLPEPRAVSPAPVGTPPLQLPPEPAALAQSKPPAKPEPPRAEELHIPLLKLVPSGLKRRYAGIIKRIYDGTQCSSCGLRFPGEAAAIYREHLDWHFRKNRREKDGRNVAYRQWFMGVEDWAAFEEVTDPEEKAHSSFFAQALNEGSPDNSAPEGDQSCPVLDGDTDEDMVCDICCEKFEQFWEETNEEWHYKGAVREHGKTYHVLCLQDAKLENQGTQEELEEEHTEHDKSVDDAEQTEETKTQQSQAREETGKSDKQPSAQESEKEVSTDNDSSVINKSDSKPEVGDTPVPAENKDRETKPDSP